MTRILPVVLPCIVLAAAVAWYTGGESDDPGGVTDASAGPARDRTLTRNALQETLPEASESRAPPAIAEATESPLSRGDQPVASPGDPMLDPATGAAVALRAPEDDQIASSPVGIPPADSGMDPATGATVVRRVPDDITAPVAASGVLPGDVEVDSATAAATPR